MDELREEISKKGIDVIAIQEPYCYQNAVPGLGLATRIVTDGKTFTSIPTVNRIHTAIAIFNSDLTVLKLEQLSNTHCVCVEITGMRFKGYIISAYFQWSENIEPYIQHLDKVLQYLKGNSIIVCADTNAKSNLWHSNCTDERGEKLENLIAQHNLYIMNRPSRTHTFSNIHGTSNIDVTLSTSTCYNKITHWRIHQDSTTSDHNLITFDIKTTTTDTTPTQQVTPRYNTKRANWKQFIELLEEQLQQDDEPQSTPDTTDADALAAKLELQLRSAADASIPRKTRFPNSAPWWTKPLTELKKQVRRARRDYQAAQNTNREEKLKRRYQTLRNNYTGEIRKAKNTSWKEFVTKEGNLNPWGIIYKIKTEKIHSETAFESIKTSTGHTATWEQTAETLLNTLIPDDSTIGETPWHINVRNETETLPTTDDTPPFATQEVENVIKSLKNGKAPGHDMIEAEMIKTAWPKIQDKLLQLMNRCLSQGKFPEIWKNGVIRVLLKGKNKDRSNPKSYRPICLLPIPSKILEKLISKRLEPVLQAHPLSSDRQFGFKRGKSTEDAIVELRRLVDRSTEKYVVALLFDIAGAFDNVWWPTILQELKRRECPRNIYKLIQSYLSDRSATIGNNANFKTTKTVNRGCPQGSILGPSFWNLIFDDVLRILHNLGYSTIAYADDLIVIISGNSRKHIEDLANAVVKAIMKWCLNHKLQLSQSKSEMVLLKGFLDIKRPPTVKIGQVSMKMSPTVRYLGVHFGTRFNITPHIHYITSKSKNIFNKLSHIAKAHWGITYKNMTILYKGIFVPVITYASAGWSDKANAWHLKELTQAQRHALLRTTRAYRTISTDALTLLAAATPIDLVLREKRAIYMLKHNHTFEIGNITYTAQGTPPSKTQINALRQQIKTETLNIWQHKWNNSTKGRTTYKYFKKVADRLTSDWMLLTFHNIQLLSGHGLLKNYQHRINVASTDNCYCDEQDSVEHVIYDCTHLAHHRIRLIQTLEEAGIRWPCRLQDFVQKHTFGEFSAFATAALHHREAIERAAPPASQTPATQQDTTSVSQHHERRITRAMTRQPTRQQS